MGVKGLWKVLRPASSTESLPRIAMDSMHASLNDYAGFRVGIDASIWFGHAEMLKTKSKMGENPELQTMFFRCARLLQAPILPIFVFDGPKRPTIKRGKMAYFKGSRLVTGMKKIADAFGFHCHFAPGEAEAELAYFNNIGLIDAVWTDDVDAFLFGATTVIRNPSSTLSGNASEPVLNSMGRDDGQHVRVYTATRIKSNEEIRLARHGLILIALLHGGDYSDGVSGIGIALAHRIAQCGFGETLALAVESTEGEDLVRSLAAWRRGLVEELRTNSLNILGKKYAKKALSFPQDFPDIETVQAYLSPAVSGTSGTVPQFDWHREPNIAQLADICELYFSWGYEEAVLHRFRSLIWPGAVTRMLRRVVVNAETTSRIDNDQPRTISASTLDTSLVVKIHGQRQHASTDFTPEVRLEINPEALVDLAKAGLGGTRSGPLDDAGSSTALNSEDPLVPLRIWMPSSLVQQAVPHLFDDRIERAEKHTKKRKRDADALTASHQGLRGEPAREILEANSNKATRASAEQLSPRVHARSGSVDKHRMGGAARTAERAVIVISDSDDDEGKTKRKSVAIDLTK